MLTRRALFERLGATVTAAFVAPTVAELDWHMYVTDARYHSSDGARLVVPTDDGVMGSDRATFRFARNSPDLGPTYDRLCEELRRVWERTE